MIDNIVVSCTLLIGGINSLIFLFYSFDSAMYPNLLDLPRKAVMRTTLCGDRRAVGKSLECRRAR